MKRVLRFTRSALLGAMLVATASPAFAEMRTFTDKEGRTMKAELVAVEGDRVRIKREDGQTFAVDPKIFSDADQKLIAKFIDDEAKKIPAGAIKLEYSRGKFNTTKQETISLITTEEDWGYSITLKSEISKPIEKIRVEYILFVQPSAGYDPSNPKPPLVQKPGKHVVDLLPLRESTTFRTLSIPTSRQQLKPGWVWGGTLTRREVRDTLHGIWIRTYVGDALIAEACSPESLATTQTWTH